MPVTGAPATLIAVPLLGVHASRQFCPVYSALT